MIRRRINGHWNAWFYDETYRENIDLIWPVDEKQMIRFMKDRFDIAYKPEKEFGATCLMINKGSGASHQLICLHEWDRTDNTDLSFLAHEAFHAAEHILSIRGIELLPDNRTTAEAYAYLIESIMRRCLILLDTRRKIA